MAQAVTHEEIHHDGLHLRLPGLEVVPADVHLVLLGEFDDARHEGVLSAPGELRRPARGHVVAKRAVEN